jgi:hypothetical protein
VFTRTQQEEKRKKNKCQHDEERQIGEGERDCELSTLPLSPDTSTQKIGKISMHTDEYGVQLSYDSNDV